MRESFIRLQCGIKSDTFFSGRIDIFFTNIGDLSPRRIEHISGWTWQIRNELFSSSTSFSAVVYTTGCHVLLPSSFTSLWFFCRRFISWEVVPLSTLLKVVQHIVFFAHLSRLDIFSMMSVNFVCPRISSFLIF